MKDAPQINFQALKNHAHEIGKQHAAPKHTVLLNKLADEFSVVDFQLRVYPSIEEKRNELAALYIEVAAATDVKNKETLIKEIKKRESKMLEDFKINTRHYYIISVEELLAVAKKNKWGLCVHNQSIYLYNGCFWKSIDEGEFISFIVKALLRMGVPEFTAKDHKFSDLVHKQFMANAYLPSPDPDKEVVVINYLNGTLEIRGKHKKFRTFKPDDFLRYQLPYPYDPHAKAPIFQKFLNTVLPDIEAQDLLAEYMGYVFIPHATLNLEKTLLLYGGGANGKSVVFNIFIAVFGTDNVSSFSLQSLTNDNGYYRARLGDVLCNYASEISGSLQTTTFKQLVSGEPIEARLPYGKPFILRNYAKLIFNTNHLPRDIEYTKAFFRRFLILPFNVTIPEKDQDPLLANKIIDNELPGVLTWVLKGLERLLENGKFSTSELVNREVQHFEQESDSVNVFLADNNYKPHPSEYVMLKDLYRDYRVFCTEDGYKPLNKSNFHKRLKFLGINSSKHSMGNLIYIAKSI